MFLCWLNVSLLIVVVLHFGPLLIETRPQVINLRHPESNQQQQQLPSRLNAKQSPVGGHRSRFTARPGNVVVHFDRHHDIQQLQYVLQDGRLATLYQRNHHPANGPVPVVVPMQASSPSQVYRRNDVKTGGSPQMLPSNIDHDQTIDILDAKMRGVSQLIGDHITVEIPEKAPGQSIVDNGGIKSPGAPSQNAAVNVLATIATDALQSGADTQFRKAGIMLEKLRGKVKDKIRDLPTIIHRKLREKSTAGHAFIDEAKSKIFIVEDGSTITQVPSSAGGNLQPAPEIQAQVVQSQAAVPASIPVVSVPGPVSVSVSVPAPAPAPALAPVVSAGQPSEKQAAPQEDQAAKQSAPQQQLSPQVLSSD